MELYSHANFHIHRATHDNEWVDWSDEEEWLIISKKRICIIVNLKIAAIIFIK